MLDLANKDFKTVIITILKGMKENISMMIKIPQKINQNCKENQM